MNTDAVISVGRQPHLRAGHPTGYSIPEPPKQKPRAWIAAGETVRHSGVDIPGPVYFGAQVRDAVFEIEPSLIDPDLLVAVAGDFFNVRGAVWVSYSSLQPTERRGYLAWLASGRDHPEVDERLIFLFMFGLERRAVIEAKTDPLAQADIPSIVAELERLRVVYAAKRNVVNAIYGLLYWIQNPGSPGRLYREKDAAFNRAFGLKAYTLLAIGQCAADGQPVSASLARTWLLQSGQVYYKDVHRAYREQFEGLFDDLYRSLFGAGVMLPMTKQSVKLHYRPFSPALATHPDLGRDIGPVADADADEIRAEAKKIKAVFETASSEIERYEALVRKRHHALGTLEVLTQLSIRLWPQESRQALRDLVEKSQGGEFVIEAAELVKAIDPSAEPTKTSFSLATELLRGMGLVVEPPLLTATGRAVKADALSMLFPAEVLAGEPEDPEIEQAALEFALAAAILGARGDGDLVAVNWLGAQLALHAKDDLRSSWKLRARIAGLAKKIPTLAEAKKAAASVPKDRLEAVAALLCAAAVAGGEPSPDQVKLLEKLYPALTLDRARVAGDLHTAAAGGQRRAAEGFALDAARIQQLQQDTRKVGQMLSGIFTEDHAEAAAAGNETDAALPLPDAAAAPAKGLLGLDPAHSSLAGEILAKPLWQRDELEVIARRLDLMLDGALERINEAAFDALDIPFTEGDGPVELNPEILEALQ